MRTLVIVSVLGNVALAGGLTLVALAGAEPVVVVHEVEVERQTKPAPAAPPPLSDDPVLHRLDIELLLASMTPIVDPPQLADPGLFSDRGRRRMTGLMNGPTTTAPEPHAAALLIVGALLTLRRRRARCAAA